jgi:hypothetical protein
MSAKEERLTVKECEDKCCADPTCKMWQALSYRGCFISAEDHWCDPTVLAYTGARKCAKDFCGGNETSYDSFEYKGPLQ